MYCNHKINILLNPRYTFDFCLQKKNILIVLIITKFCKEKSNMRYSLVSKEINLIKPVLLGQFFIFMVNTIL